MPIDEKPSRNEDEYFAREEADLLKGRRARIEEEAKQAERRTHFMRCPKCGAELKEQDLKGVKVDVCGECRGLWFDAGELDQLKPDDKNPMRQIFGDFFTGLRR